MSRPRLETSLFGGRKDLLLVKYKWYLQDFDTGKIIASYKYHIESTDLAAAKFKRKLMVDYVMTEDTVNGRPVYQRPGYNYFLFMASNSRWAVGPNTDEDAGWLRQKEKYCLGPDVEGAWDYGVRGADGKVCWKGDDTTLKAYPWYKCSPWKTDFHSDSNVYLGSINPASTPSTALETRANTPATAFTTPIATTPVLSKAHFFQGAGS